MNLSRSATLAMLSLLALVVLAGCATTAAPGKPTPVSDADATISSGSMSFDATTLDVPAGRPFTLLYVNRTPMPHNVAIYSDASASNSLFVGEVIGEQSITYEVPAMPAGEYYFHCDLHPEMNGTVVSR
ncbi:MAG TPA: cupredoxin domain-containing protein [Candidatus Limnocylindria bacterium]|nr:cupredoxin domain-containing protein [Candidatus Limnocylindria bacterium]